jgi:hypothetical protein
MGLFKQAQFWNDQDEGCFNYYFDNLNERLFCYFIDNIKWDYFII